MAKLAAVKRPRRKARNRRGKARKALVRAAKAPSLRAMEAALAGIAHDIRTPLTGIVALAELLASSDLGQREREWANALKSGADHLAALTTVIVDAAKAEATGLTLRHEPFAPRALAEAVGAALAARAGNKNISTDVKIAQNLPDMVAGDALRLRAALENLADNAVKFTEAGTVTFSASAAPASGNRVRLTFTLADSGIGIEPRELKRLFRPFAQANEVVARRYGGAGLGLVFVKRLAKAMGGDLKLVSEKGRGSAFHLTVLTDRVDARPSVEAGGPRQAPGRALSVLCAEDNPYGRVVMNTILGELGHKVDFVETGEAAVKVTERGGYDAVLMDVTLSGIDGFEATRRIRALPGKLGEVLVIGISGRSEAGAAAAARAAGMNFYFVKPVSPGKLAQALGSIRHPEAAAKRPSKDDGQ